MYKHSNKNVRKAKYLRRPIDVKTYQKPFYFLKDKWQSFRSYSTKKQIAIIGGVVGLLLLIIPIASYLYFIRDIKDPERLMNRKNTGILITDRHGEVVYSYGQTSGDEFYKLEDISDNIEQALIASEDGNFYSHSGFSIRSIAGAFVGNILNKDLTRYGGSTISQQLVKNTLLTNSKTYLRKYQELSMAIALEREYTKDEILEMYLNSVYFGEGAFGIGRAADIYFDKEPSELTLAESSVLIGLLPAPALYSPISGDPEQTKQQQERVLTKMVEQGDIKEAEIAKTLGSNIQYAAKEDEERFYAQHFVQMILSELRERYGEERVTRGGFTIKSSLDLNSQKQVEETVLRNIENIKSNDASNAALVAIDPKTNEILALVGSVDWSNEAFGQVNMTVTPRQPGSSFKPIYYAEALDKKLITNSTILKDERRTFADGYAPENYDFRFRGDVTTRYALALSLNIPAIEVMEKVGMRESAEAAERMGIEGIDNPEEYGLTLALGTAEASLLDMTNAYAAFANEGQSEDTSLIMSIEDKYNKNIFTKKTEQKLVQSEEASHLVSSILSDERARSGLYGTALNLNSRKAAVKTGTTNDNVDAWTIGYTPSLVIGVWVGNNDHSPMRVGSGASAGPIWRDSMQSILEGTDAEEFDKPQDVIEQNVCSVNGSYKEVYIAGTEPGNPCHIPTQAELDAIKKKEEEERRAKEEAENEENESEKTDSEEDGEGSPEEDGAGGDGSEGGDAGGDGSGDGTGGDNGTGGDGNTGGDGSGDGTGGDGSGTSP